MDTMFPSHNGALASGHKKNIMEGKGTIRFNVTDIFWTNLPKATVTYEGRYVENWHAKRETRVANLSFTYRFGSNKVQGARNRKTGSEEERPEKRNQWHPECRLWTGCLFESKCRGNF